MRSVTPRDGGSVALEVAVLTPALLAVGLLIVAAGRVAHAGDEVQAVAGQAARAASLQRDLPGARTAAEAEARAALAGDGTTCTDMTVTVSGAFDNPLGTPGTVQVVLTCTATLTDLALPGLPGSKVLTAQAIAPIDSWRGRR